jgi:uncharacterized protein (DUF697 family)
MPTQKTQSSAQAGKVETKEKKEETLATRKQSSARQEEAEKLITHHMGWSALAGFVPVPIYDFAAVTGSQLHMLKKMSEIYDVPFRDEAGKKIIAALISTLGAAAIGKALAASLIKSIPVIGTATGLLLMPALASASTYALGHVFIKHFETGGNLLDLDVNKMETFFKEKLQEGKKIASDLQAKSK